VPHAEGSSDTCARAATEGIPAGTRRSLKAHDLLAADQAVGPARARVVAATDGLPTALPAW